jgi:hypothetical protein
MTDPYTIPFLVVPLVLSPFGPLLQRLAPADARPGRTERPNQPLKATEAPYHRSPG